MVYTYEYTYINIHTYSICIHMYIHITYAISIINDPINLKIISIIKQISYFKTHLRIIS